MLPINRARLRAIHSPNSSPHTAPNQRKPRKPPCHRSSFTQPERLGIGRGRGRCWRPGCRKLGMLAAVSAWSEIGRKVCSLVACVYRLGDVLRYLRTCWTRAPTIYSGINVQRASTSEPAEVCKSTTNSTCSPSPCDIKRSSQPQRSAIALTMDSPSPLPSPVELRQNRSVNRSISSGEIPGP